MLVHAHSSAGAEQASESKLRHQREERRERGERSPASQGLIPHQCAGDSAAGSGPGQTSTRAM